MIAARWMIAVGETARSSSFTASGSGEIGPADLGVRHQRRRLAVGRHVKIGGDDMVTVDCQLSHGFRADQPESPGDQHGLAHGALRYTPDRNMSEAVRSRGA